MKKHVLVFICSLLIIHPDVSGQEMWGINNSNYAGNLGVALNPSSIVGTNYNYDLNILTVDIFLQNNLAYFPASDKLVYRTFAGTSDSPKIVIDSLGNSKKSLFMHVDVLGPSFVWCQDKKSSWAFQTSFRTEAGILKVPYGLDNFGVAVTNSAAGQALLLSVPHFTAAMMSWTEIGVTYGRVAVNETNKYIKWGATLNYIIPLDGMYLNIRNATYKTNDSTGSIQSADATIGHDITNGQDVLANRGWGIGSTIGFTYIKGRFDRAYSLFKAADDLQKYKYRFGVSLMDIGFARFNSNDASTVDLSKTGGSLGGNLDNLQFNNFHELDTALVNRIGGKVTNAPFNIWLPTALSAQFDYALSPHWYANLTALNRVHWTANQIARGNQDVLSLRYERRVFSMAFNVNLFEYSSLSTGFCLRYKGFIIGSDRVSQLASLTNFNAIDIYFGFRFNFADLPPKTTTSVSCPAYKSH